MPAREGRGVGVLAGDTRSRGGGSLCLIYQAAGEARAPLMMLFSLNYWIRILKWISE